MFGIFLILSSSISPSFAELIYDPETNSYIDSNEENVVVVNVEWQEDIDWIPVEEEATVGTAEPDSEEDEVDEASDAEWSDDVVWISVGETSETTQSDSILTAAEIEAAIETATAAKEKEIAEEEAKKAAEAEAERIAAEAAAKAAAQVDPVWSPTDPILKIEDIEPEMAVTTTAVTSVKTHKELIALLNQTRKLLSAYLTDQTADLWNAYNSALSTKYGDWLSEVVACLSDDNDIVQLDKEIKNVVAQVNERLNLEVSDLYTEIVQLNYNFGALKIIDKEERNTESSLIAAKIDVFNQNYISLIDFKAQQIRAWITEFINSDRAKKMEKQLNVFITRKWLLDQVKQTFDLFENSSFFSQTVVWPRADELYVLADDTYELFLNNMNTRWWRRDADTLTVFQADLKPRYDAFVESQIDELFPFGQVQSLYNSYATLTEAYWIEDDDFICSAVLTNKIADTVAPQLLEKIQTAQETIAIAQSAVWTPESWGDLQIWFSKVLENYYRENLDLDFSNLLSQVEEPELTESEQLFYSIKPQVVDFLIDLRKKHVDNDRLDAFEAMLGRAQTKLQKLLSSDATDARTTIILLAIEEAIEDVLNR